LHYLQRANKFFVRKGRHRSGTFIAAVGADDSTNKKSIRRDGVAKVVADSLEQSCTIGTRTTRC